MPLAIAVGPVPRVLAAEFDDELLGTGTPSLFRERCKNLAGSRAFKWIGWCLIWWTVLPGLVRALVCACAVPGSGSHGERLRALHPPPHTHTHSHRHRHSSRTRTHSSTHSSTRTHVCTYTHTLSMPRRRRG
jgi:hypothetical protein